MNSRILLTITLLVMTFGTFALYGWAQHHSPHKAILEQELLVKMHDVD